MLGGMPVLPQSLSNAPSHPPPPSILPVITTISFHAAPSADPAEIGSLKSQLADTRALLDEALEKVAAAQEGQPGPEAAEAARVSLADADSRLAQLEAEKAELELRAGQLEVRFNGPRADPPLKMSDGTL